MTTYLDCNATTPPDERVLAEVVRFLRDDFGNAGSRTHEFGATAKKAVQRARDQVAAVANCAREEVLFTSGATESNNLAILGLAEEGEKTGRRHLISTAIEHKAVLEPLEVLARRGFEIELVRPNAGGWVEPAEVQKALRADTLLVSVMNVNNETGVTQPILEIASILEGHPAYFHVDAAQGFGKEPLASKCARVDLLSISGHKIHAPKGVGALVTRRRAFQRPPIRPLHFGGGQEFGIRPGTVPVALVVGLGLAAELAAKESEARTAANRETRRAFLKAIESIPHVLHGDQNRVLPHCVNVSFPGVDSEAAIVALRGFVACSNGSACTSQSYSPSHVLTAMGLPADQIAGALRLSWCHLTPATDWAEFAARIAALR